MKGVINVQGQSIRSYFSALQVGDLFFNRGEYFRKISQTHALNLNLMKPLHYKGQIVVRVNRAIYFTLPCFERGERTTYDMIPVGSTFTLINCCTAMHNTVMMKISESETMYMETLTMSGWDCSSDDVVELVSCDEVKFTLQ